MVCHSRGVCSRFWTTLLRVDLLVIVAAASSSEEQRNGPRNVLYIVLDDLRPDISPYTRHPRMLTPHMQQLADQGVVFERAYAQQAVCAPSRMSFLTGRRPNTTQAWNFLNHVRQADCGDWHNRRQWIGKRLKGTRRGDGVSFNASDGVVGRTGGAGQCCTDCSASDGCVGWNMLGGECVLFSAIDGHTNAPCFLTTTQAPADDEKLHCCNNRTLSRHRHRHNRTSCMSGIKGQMHNWTTLPQLFETNGFLTMGTGKVFHDTNAGLGVLGDDRYPQGNGLPPLSDPVSWTNNSMQNREYSHLHALYGAFTNALGGCAYTGGAGRGYVDTIDECSNWLSACHPTVGANGSVPAGVENYCDFITYNDAIEKLEFASRDQQSDENDPECPECKAHYQRKKGFFLAVGIRRPHLSWRVPKKYTDLYPPHSVALPLQRTLASNINPIAYTQFPWLGGDAPRLMVNSDNRTRQLRADYYSAVSWADFCVGSILAALDRLGLAANTAVVLHADHGFHLGEYNMWEKRTLWNNALQVPLIIRVPWLQRPANGRVGDIVELVDLYKTTADLMEVPLPPADFFPVEGVSLVPLLQATNSNSNSSGAKTSPTVWVPKPALSMYPRCPADSALLWLDNDCIHTTERVDFDYMGCSMVIDYQDGNTYRFTLWPRWNASALAPVWSDVQATELYNHSTPLPEGVSAFDWFENSNIASRHQELVQNLTLILKSSFSVK